MTSIGITHSETVQRLSSGDAQHRIVWKQRRKSARRDKR